MTQGSGSAYIIHRTSRLFPFIPFHTLMRIAMTVAGALCVLMGGVWILQGINVLPGSFMTGQTKWAVYGGVLAAVGVAVLLGARRR